MTIKQHIDWSIIDTVLLDMDGTLLDLHFDNVFWLEWVPTHYAKQHGLTIEQAKEQLYEQFASQHGLLTWYCVDYWTEQLNIDIAELKKELVHLIEIRPVAEEFLLAIKKAGKKIHLVTNAHHKSVNLKMDKTGLAHYFDTIISSHSVGFPKESQLFWAHVQPLLGFDAARTLFIDDSLPVLKSADDYGIAYVLAIHQPDSKQPPKAPSEYPAIESFHDIMPPA